MFVAVVVNKAKIITIMTKECTAVTLLLELFYICSNCFMFAAAIFDTDILFYKNVN